MNELLELAISKGYEHEVFFVEIREDVEFEESGENDFLNLCLIQKWLRDKHDIDVFIEPYAGDFFYGFWIMESKDITKYKSKGISNDYVEVLTEALKKGVELC